jgi:phospholipid N-methyltransferase
MVELNPTFAAHAPRLRDKPPFRNVASRCHLIEVACRSSGKPTDVVISGLPLNNFSRTMCDDSPGV